MTHARTKDAPAERIQLRSRFAQTDVDPKDIVTFPDGIPGYERSREFVLLDSADLAPLKVLHAVREPDPCFLTIDPRSVLEGYRCELGAADCLRLGVSDASTLVWLAIVGVNEKGETAANLRAPIVINAERMIGRQVMPNSCVYPLHHVLAQAE